MKSKVAFMGPYTEDLFWYEHSDLRQFTKLRGGQSLVDFDAADNCRLYVATMKAMNFQDDIPSIPVDNFKQRYLLVFDLTSTQNATENCHFPELVGEELRLELNFTFPREHITELIVLEERLSSVTVDNFSVFGNKIQTGFFSLQQIFNRFPQFKYWYLGSFSFDYVSIPPKETFAIIKKQPSEMHGEH